MTKLSRSWPIVIMGTTIIVSVFTYVLPGNALQPLLLFWFLLICPGMAWVRLIRLEGTMVELSLALGLSISLDALVTFAFLYSHAWSPDGMLISLLIISFTGAVVQLASRSSVFYRRPNVKQSTAPSLAPVSSFTQQETRPQLSEMQTQSVPVFHPSHTASNGKQQPIEKLDTVRMPALLTTPQETRLHLTEMQTQSVPTLPPSPGTQHKEEAHLDEIHTQMLPVPTPPSKSPRRGLMSFVPPTPQFPSVPPTPTFPSVPPTPQFPSVPPTPQFPSVPPTPILPFDEPTPEVPAREKDKQTVSEPHSSPAQTPGRKDAIDTAFFDLVHALLLTSQDEDLEKPVPTEQSSSTAAAAKSRDTTGSPQAPRTPHPLLAEQDENKQNLDAFVDDDNDDTAKTPSVIVTPKSEKKEK